jgi:hypothetical protein
VRQILSWLWRFTWEFVVRIVFIVGVFFIMSLVYFWFECSVFVLNVYFSLIFHLPLSLDVVCPLLLPFINQIIRSTPAILFMGLLWRGFY